MHFDMVHRFVHITVEVQSYAPVNVFWITVIPWEAYLHLLLN